MSSFPSFHPIPPPQESNSTKFKRLLKSSFLAFGMGTFIGSSVVVLHTVMQGLPRAGLAKRALGSGVVFGSIFAVGPFIRS
jgi:hypothetical protein